MSTTEVPDVPPGISGPPGPLLKLLKDQRIAFLGAGAVNTAVGAIWFIIFDHVFGNRFGWAGHYVALVFSYIAAILCAFVLYRKLVFRVQGHLWQDLRRFSSVYLTTFLLNLVMVTIFVEWLGLNAVVMQMCFVVVSSTVSWFGHRHYSFRRDPSATLKKE